MNRAYRLIWSEAQQAFVAAAEFARARGKRGGAVLLLSAAFLAVPPGPVFAANLPQGGQIVAGTGSIAQSGNTLTVTQGSDKFAANWQSFSIGQGHTVQFVQPSSSAVALNRVLGSDVSVIQGALKANGQVYLINPNGVLFTPTAQVNVGGLIASTQNLSSEDFLAGRLRFSGHSTAAIRNEGQITAAPGGTVALIAAKIENTGSIAAPQGNVLLGAGKAVTLDLGGPVKIQVEEGALEALIDQGGAIRADGGYVYLTAQAAGDLASAAINHTGITEAKTLATGEKGEIWLMGDMTHGQVNVAGTLDASAPTSGDGGFIETSAAKVKVADGASVRAGHWLIDPNDFTIAASGGDITGATLSVSLASGNVTIQSATGATSGNGDIFVNDEVAWNANKLTLSAHRDIYINRTLDGSGTAQLALEYGQGAPESGNTADYFVNAKVNLPAGINFFTRLGSGGTVYNYRVITSLGSEGSTTGTDLQGINGNLIFNYALGADIDASATSGWNSGAGFMPIGTGTAPFTGRFDGLGHVVSNLSINRPATNMVGLFGRAAYTQIRHVGVAGGSIAGGADVGGLIGANTSSSVARSFSSATVSASGQRVGGLVGDNDTGSEVIQSYASGNVSSSFNGNASVGGLVGQNAFAARVVNSYSTGNVSGATYASQIGGLVGINNSSAWISRSYATGNVSGGSSFVGGLVGRTFGSSFASYWNTETSGQSGSAEGAGLTTAQMQQQVSYSGWDFTNVWRIYAGQSYPVLRTFQREATVTGSIASRTYDGTSYSGGNGYASTAPVTGTPIYGGTSQGARNAGSYAIEISGLTLNRTTQQDYQNWGDTLRYVIGLLTITPKALTVSGITAANKVYDGTTNAAVTYSNSNFGGLITGDVITASGAFADKNAGTGKSVTLTFGGADTDNYSFTGQSTTTADIMPRPVQVTADAKSKTQGQSDPPLTYASGCPTGLSTDCGLVTGETLAGSLSRDAGEAVGAYTIRQGTVTDANNTNYTISYHGADLTIAAAAGGGAVSTGGAMNDASGSALASAQRTAAAIQSPSPQGMAAPLAPTAAPGLALVEVSSELLPRSDQGGGSTHDAAAGSPAIILGDLGRDAAGFMRLIVVDGGINLGMHRASLSSNEDKRKVD